MATDITVNEKKYVICYSLENKVLHYVELKPGNNLSTGQPEVELYDTEEEVISRISELGFNPDDYIVKYTFLSYGTEDDCWDDIYEINNCLDFEQPYIDKPLRMIDTSNLSFIGYIILVDDKIKSCLSPLEKERIMTSSANQVIIN
jgi:hypothetical protein